MPKVIDVINEIEKFAPPCLAESYDNVGLMVGSKNTDVTGVYIALNLSERVIEDAINNGVAILYLHIIHLFLIRLRRLTTIALVVNLLNY